MTLDEALDQYDEALDRRKRAENIYLSAFELDEQLEAMARLEAAQRQLNIAALDVARAGGITCP